jgi:hypothetical protein
MAILKRKNKIEEENEYDDDFEEDDEIKEDIKKNESDEESIEEDLDLEIDDNDDSGSDVEKRMDELDMKQRKLGKQQEIGGEKRRAISAKYELKSKMKPNIPKGMTIQKKQGVQDQVIKALREENQNIKSGKSSEKPTTKAKPTRPFSHIKLREDSSKKQTDISKGKFVDSKINYEISDPSACEERLIEKESEVSSLPKTTRHSVDSQMSKTNIIRKIENLSDNQRNQLLLLLEMMEKGQPMEKIDMGFLSKEKSATMQPKKEIKPDSPKRIMKIPKRNELRIRVLSTWGHIQVAGLTEIELFATSGAKITLVPANIKIMNNGGKHSDVSKLINNCYLTKEHNSMWV